MYTRMEGAQDGCGVEGTHAVEETHAAEGIHAAMSCPVWGPCRLASHYYPPGLVQVEDV